MAVFSMNSILVQPTSLFTNLGLVIQFHCEGSQGASYQWQKQFYGNNWEDILVADNITANTDTLTWVPDRYDIRFRCAVSFPDPETLYTDSAEITPGSPPNVGMYDGWYYSERYGGLDETQHWHNINRLMSIFVGQWHWTPECASAVCGNIWAESSASPGTWETWPLHGEEDTGRGYGFVQWTAARTTYIAYCNATFPLTQWRNNGTYQVSRLKYEWDHNIEWVGHGGWNNVYSDIAPADLSDRFILGYLRPTQAEYERTRGNRMRLALRVYENYKRFLIIPILKKMTIEGRRNR